MSRTDSSRVGGDLRQTPGSASYDEARNLYFGESYPEEALSRWGERLLDSICIGRSIAVYFADRDLRGDLRDLVSEFGQHHILDRDLERGLKVHRLERDKPHLVFTKLLLWVYARVGMEKRLRRIVDLLKETEGVIFFAPGREKVKYSTIPLPRLDFFVSNWLEVDGRRRALERMRDYLHGFMRRVERAARKRREQGVAGNMLELLTAHYDALCAHLLKQGSIDPGSLRRITDLIIELSDRYGEGISLSWIRELTPL